MHGASIGAWWRAARAAWAFPRSARPIAWAAARAAASGAADHTYTRHAGEPVGARRCAVCCSDDVATEGWIRVGNGLVCGDCSHAMLDRGLAHGRTVAAYRGRAGSPRRALGEVYQTVVAFKERRGDWPVLADQLARALARSIDQLPGADATSRPRALVVPVPSYRGRRPHVRLLTALATVGLPQVAPRLDLLEKIRDFRQKGLTPSQRRAESSGAYAIRTPWRAAVRGRHVIVTDDIVTTGATLDACAQPLLAAGAAAVDGAAIVRVVRAPPERMLALGARQVRVQLRELDGRGRTALSPESGFLWVQFGCSLHCAATAAAGPYPLPTLDAIAYHRWICRCGSAHLVRLRREWCGDTRECLAVGVGDRRPPELLVGILQGPPTYAS